MVDAEPGRSDTSPERSRPGDEAARLAAALRERIVRGVLEPGARLRQERLAAAFETSRMPVREALRMLADEGLVELAPNRGAVVARLDPAAVIEIAEMRAAAETLALRVALPEMSDRVLDGAAAIQAEAERAGLDGFGALNGRFHLALYAPAPRPRLLAHIVELGRLADRYLVSAAVRLDYVERSHEEHRRLLEACRRRDADAASAILARHILDAGRALSDALARS